MFLCGSAAATRVCDTLPVMSIRKTLSERIAAAFGIGDAEEPALRPSPRAARELGDLEAEQRRLSVDVEEQTRSYDAACRRLAERIAAFASSKATMKDVERIRGEQHRLWKLIRRAQAAERSSRELEREYLEWRSRSGEDGIGIKTTHPDHPRTRMEIVASELRVRGIDPPEPLVQTRGYEGSAGDVAEPDELAADAPEPVADPQSAAVLADEDAPVWEEESGEIRLREVDDAARELRRLLARDDADVRGRDIAEAARILRTHHGALRLRDRREGVRRYRLDGLPL